MGLLDDIAGAATGGDKDKGMMEAISGLLGGEGGSGLQSLVENFTKGGLGETVSSWIGTGSNLPISADQIASVLGSDQVKALAGKLGISTEDASSKLASILPQVVDKITPEGKVPDAAPGIGDIGGLLKSLGI